MKYLNTILLVVFLASCNTDKKQNPDDNAPGDTQETRSSGIPAPKPVSYAIISEFPHDTSSFTEGLELYKGKLYESGGDYINSRLQYGNHKTGAIAEVHKMGTDEIFAEGITILKDKIYQLTYQAHVGYVYDVNNIKSPVKTFNWPYEGWGMTNNGTDLIIDTGTPNLYFVDPETFRIKTSVVITDDKGPVDDVNELEYIDGFVWGNVWNTNRIIKIDPESGHVVAEMIVDKIAAPDGRTQIQAFPNTDVLNGIAYDSATKSMLITGKRWPKLYEVRIN